MQYLKQYGAQLVALGYRIVPIPPGSKGPRRAGWQKLQATEDMVARWTANGSADDGVGILAAHTPAIDVDVLDPVIASRMQDALETLLGPLPHIRIGRAPKFLIPFRCDTPFRKLSSAVYVDPLTGDEHRVEVLGDGQQWVAYHQHPDTLQPYDWARGGLLGLPHDDLPVLTAETAQAVVDAFEVIAAELVASGEWELKARARETPKPAASDPLLDWKPTIDFKVLKSALSKIPNAGRDELDYEAWRDIIFAIHHETQGADHGFALANAWSARSGKHDPAFLAERVWPYITDDRSRAVTGLTVLKRARALGWSPEAVKPELPPRGRLTQIAEFAQLRPVSWLIKGVLPAAELAVVYGASGSGKSFFVLDMVAAIARGIEWRGRKTRQCPVVYIAAEGASGFRARTLAYGRHQDADLTTMPFHVLPSAVDLVDGYLELCEDIEQIGGAGIVVVDTLSAVTPGLDENTGRDMGQLVNACRQVHAATGALVILVHHSGKDAEQGARGWSGLRAACDCEIRVTQEGPDRAARITKQKDGEEGMDFGFCLSVVQVGFDEDNDPVTSCVVEETDFTPPEAQPRKRIGKVQAAVVEAYWALCPPSGEGVSEPLLESAVAESTGKKGYDVRKILREMLDKEIFTRLADLLVLAKEYE